MTDWSARQYLQFEDDRTRPSRDLLAQIPLTEPRLVIDVGCGPGNSTELLVERYSHAEVMGLDSSPNMLRQARERLPKCTFIEADIATWSPEVAPDLLFANAVFQWVPNHRAVLRRLLQGLPEGGVLAVQMPDNTREPALALMSEVAGKGPWAVNAAFDDAARADLAPPETYYDLLKPVCTRVDLWHITYNHVMDGPEAVVEWFKGSGLRPFIDAVDPAMREDFLKAYLAQITRHYARRNDGRVLLKFPRFFIVATR